MKIGVWQLWSSSNKIHFEDVLPLMNQCLVIYLFIIYLFLFQETVSISSLEFETALYPLILESSGAHEPQYRTRQYDINNYNIIYEHNQDYFRKS